MDKLLPLLATTIALALYCGCSVADAAAGNPDHHLRRNLRHHRSRALRPAGNFPSYSQQCRDDAGPLFVDDAETYAAGGKYFDGTPATAVGPCTDPVKGACLAKTKKEAFLEGPIDCGGSGWYCRIEEEPEWPALNLSSDVNFGYCNVTEGFEDPGWDRSGHCHGSDADEAYYWWVRDHWFRGYNGRLRCCCGWETDVKEGRIVNRCDHRRLVTEAEDVENCRDANEEGSSPYNGGCNQNGNSPAIGQPIPEDDSKCWEISKFGNPEDGPGDDENDGSDDEEEASESEDGDQSGEETSPDDEEESNDEDEEESNDEEISPDDEEESNDEGNSPDDEEESNDEDEEESNDGTDSEDEEETSESTDEDTEDVDDEDEEEEQTCEDVKKFIWKKKGGETIQKNCAKWVARKIKANTRFCKKKTREGIRIGEHCPVTCGWCGSV